MRIQFLLKPKAIIQILLLGLLSETAFAENDTLKIESQYTLGGDGFSYHIGSLALASDGSLFALGHRSAALTSLSGEFVLWRIPSKNTALVSHVFGRSGKDQRLVPIALSTAGLTILKNGGFVFAARLDGNNFSIIRMSPEGKVLFSKEIPTPYGSGLITRIILENDKSFVLVGYQNGNGFLMELDDKGAKKWVEDYDFGNTEDFSGGFRTMDGDILIVANSGDFEGILDEGPSQVWLIKYNNSGKKISEQIFSGRRAEMCGSFAKPRNESCFLLYDKSANLHDSAYVAIGIDKDLEKLWEVPIDEGEDFDRFKIACVPGSGFVVAGCTQNALLVCQFSSDGKQLAKIKIPIEYGFCDLELVCSASQAYVAYQTITRGNYDVREERIITIRLVTSKK